MGVYLVSKDIVFVCHCLINLHSKVSRDSNKKTDDEERVRKEFLHHCLEQDIQLVQLPCPEFTLYGPQRWGHVKEQFNNIFFRDHSRMILTPFIKQIIAYRDSGAISKPDILGIIGIEGSPSCGVNRTCSGPWGGEFSGNPDFDRTLQGIRSIEESGVFIEVLKDMLSECNIDIPIIGFDRMNPYPLYDLTGSKNE